MMSATTTTTNMTMVASCSPLLTSLGFRHTRSRVSLLGLNRGSNTSFRSRGVSFGMSNPSPQASLRGDVEAAGAPASVPVRVAHELLQAGHRYLDVRTPEEFSAGHASGAINIPYMHKVGSGMSKNAGFVQEVSGRFAKDDEIIVGCQSGKRSLMAARDLVAEGFTAVTDIAGGYAAWTQNGLPTES
ncbi:hypothetical protein MLD38_029558 [Melastoma candidum]|uniref:Uncharacterized protein n=1 Tax=Melastoma candidum TaxID=119954 RepID=A0ACB9N677_9MYRT|nr:hypothetical protein MLD38_029558 [Melastoma candidum]